MFTIRIDPIYVSSMSIITSLKYILLLQQNIDKKCTYSESPGVEILHFPQQFLGLVSREDEKTKA